MELRSKTVGSVQEIDCLVNTTAEKPPTGWRAKTFWNPAYRNAGTVG